jgi:hypothetical protein
VFSGVLPFPGEVDPVQDIPVNQKMLPLLLRIQRNFPKTDYSPLFIIFENVAENVAELQNDSLKINKNGR